MSTEKIKQLTHLYQSGVLTKKAYEAAIANLQPTPQTAEEEFIANFGRTGRSEIFYNQGGHQPFESVPETNNDELLASTRMGSNGPPKAETQATSAQAKIEIGATLADRYIITRKLGEGGMGAVYLAVDKDTQQDVALKTISEQHAANPQMMEMLRKEVATARTLSANKHLLRILDIHLRAQPPFIAMEAVLGGDLQEYWMSMSRKLPQETVQKILAQTLDALESLHESRIVHQDIKPQNILLTKDFTVKITDYGISKSLKDLLSEGGSNGSGTVLYMSPEQVRGDICDRRTDLYAVGIMVYQLLVGKFPFPTESQSQIERWHMNGTRDCSNLPAPFDKIVDKLLKVNPDDRYSSAKEVLEQLKSKTSELSEPKIQAPPLPPPSVDVKWNKWINSSALSRGLDIHGINIPIPQHPDNAITDMHRMLSAISNPITILDHGVFKSRFQNTLSVLEKWAFFYPQYRGPFVDLWNQSLKIHNQGVVTVSYFSQEHIRAKYVFDNYVFDNSVSQSAANYSPPMNTVSPTSTPVAQQYAEVEKKPKGNISSLLPFILLGMFFPPIWYLAWKHYRDHDW